jgi:hypothetical protein
MVQELILEFDSDAHTSEAEDISPPQSEVDIEQKGKAKTHIHCTNNMQSYPFVLVIHKFTRGSKWVKKK